MVSSLPVLQGLIFKSVKSGGHAAALLRVAVMMNYATFEGYTAAIDVLSAPRAKGSRGVAYPLSDNLMMVVVPHDTVWVVVTPDGGMSTVHFEALETAFKGVAKAYPLPWPGDRTYARHLPSDLPEYIRMMFLTPKS